MLRYWIIAPCLVWICLQGLAPTALAADEELEFLTAPDLARVVRIFESKTGEEVSLPQLVERLAKAEVVFLGETHLDESTHRFQWQLYEELVAQRDGKVILGMEQFERDAQPALDRYLAGEIDERQFRRQAGVWSNYDTDYRPMIEFARRKGLRVVGTNYPRSLRSKSYDSLSAAERALVPAVLYDNSDAYWERFDRTVRGHFGDMVKDPVKRRLSAQCLWDNAMGEGCVKELQANPDHLILHTNGGFHTLYRQGTAEQVLKRMPEARVVCIDINPTTDLALAGAPSDASVADYVVFADSRAHAINEGTHGVTVGMEMEFALDMPDGASKEHPVPLLVWLPREGLRATDGLRYWQLALGDSVAIASIEAPIPQMGEDLHLGGHWYFSEGFSERVGLVGDGLERVVGRILERFPIDGRRVVVAGERTAATAVARAMLYSGSLPVQAFAVAPSAYTKLREGGLPRRAEMPAARFEFPYQDLTVFTDSGSHDWWSAELAEYATTGMRTAAVPLESADPARQVENAIRGALGLDSIPAATGEPVTIGLRVDSPLASYWASLEARALLARDPDRPVRVVAAKKSAELALLGESGTVSGSIQASSFRDGRLLPLAPGPFGGTTLLVTFPSTPEAERRAWEEVANSPAMHARSRFARLKVAHTAEGPSLADTLDELRNAGRNNVLIVPAAYCASPEEMRAIRQLTVGHTDGMTIHWLPGLGGRFHLRHGFADRD